MAEEAVTNEEANGEDDATPKINGVEESITEAKESYSADTSKTEDVPESPMVLQFENSLTRDKSPIEEFDASEVNENANGENDTIGMNTNCIHFFFFLPELLMLYWFFYLNYRKQRFYEEWFFEKNS